MIVGYTKVLNSQSRGVFIVKFYLTADKNHSKSEREDIYKAIAKALYVEFQISIPDNLKEAGDTLKAKYKDVDYFLEDTTI